MGIHWFHNFEKTIYFFSTNSVTYMSTKQELWELEKRQRDLRERDLKFLKLKIEIKKNSVNYLEEKIKKKKEKLKILEAAIANDDITFNELVGILYKK